MCLATGIGAIYWNFTAMKTRLWNLEITGKGLKGSFIFCPQFLTSSRVECLRLHDLLSRSQYAMRSWLLLDSKKQTHCDGHKGLSTLGGLVGGREIEMLLETKILH